MFNKFKKYIIGFFALAGGILFAFLSGKSAGRKQENPFDKTIANALANGEVEMSIKKNTQ